LVAVPAKKSSLFNFGFSISTSALREDGIEGVAFLRVREEFADPDNLLETLLFTDFKNDLLGATKLIGWKSVTPVYKERNVGLSSGARRGWHLVEGPPVKSEGSWFVECADRKT
jgi:hypothetical protein